MSEDRDFAAFRVNNANLTMMRQLLEQLLTARVLEPDEAAQIVRTAIDENLPAEDSSGQMYDLARQMFLAMEKAYRSYPTMPESRGAGGSPRKDLE